jgi:hypothetical protein
MKKAISSRLLVTIVTVFVLSLNHLCAQAPADVPACMTVKVKGLTSAGRDAIARSLDPSTGVRLAFACVPAGILVFEGEGARDRSTVREQAMQRATQHVRRQDITELNIGRQEAEEQCAVARNR